MSRKRRERRHKSRSAGSADPPLPPPPDDRERATWPAYWHALSARVGSPPSADQAEAWRRGEYRRIGQRTWQWGSEADGYDAVVAGNAIIWNWHGPKDFGNSIGQSVVDFIAFGPQEQNAPDRLAWEMFEAIRARDLDRWPSLLSEAGALAADKTSTATSWEWRNEFDRYSAWLTSTGIYWCWEGPKDLGGAAEQSFEDFLSKGPLDRDAPDFVVRQIREAIAARGQDIPSQPGNGRSIRSGRLSVRQGPDDAAPADETSVPIGALLAQGLAVVAVSTGAALALATALPTAAKYLGIIVPVLFGFAAAFRWGSLALIAAGFFAMVAGFGSQIAYERYAELAQGPVVELGSIAAAPGHPDATRFVVADVRAERTLTGSTRREVFQTSGAGPRRTVWVHQVMPLVPAGWTRSRPVPAWIACTASPGFDCLRRISDVKHTVRLRDRDLPHARAAIADAERRHGLIGAAAAPVLEHFNDPVGAPVAYLVGIVLVPLACFALWALGVLGWRIYRRRRSGDTRSV